jgi:[ribosomal protein S5]-alanine N-acetyltransferase
MPGVLGVDRIATARLVGRRPEAGDADGYVRFYTDTRTPEEVWPEHLRTAAQARLVLDASIRHWDRFGFGVWTVLLTDEVIGRVGLQHTRVSGRPEVELAWFIHPDHWSRGYATEMAREAVRVGFEVLELDDVVAFTVPANQPSRAVMEKLGMTYERDIEHVGLPHALYRLRAAAR